MYFLKIVLLISLGLFWNKVKITAKQDVPIESRKREIRIKKFPSLVQIRMESKSQDPEPVYLCSGNLITLNNVVTTAKCVYNAKVMVVSAGLEFFPRNATTTVRVTDVRIHPKYIFGEYGYNLAVLTLSENLKESDKIKPIEIDTCNNCNCKWAGWGYFFYNVLYTKLMSDNQKKTNSTPIMLPPGRKIPTQFLLGYTGVQKNQIDCENELENVMQYKRKFMTCRQDNVYDGTCTQEDGLGLQCNKKLVGISIESKCSDNKSTLFVFYNIFRHRNWILNLSNDTIENRNREYPARYNCKLNSALKPEFRIGTIYFIGICMIILQRSTSILYK